MANMARLGIRLDPIPQINPREALELSVLAEKLGYQTLWVPEGGGRDSLTQLAAFAGVTKTIQLGTGILPVFSRTPTVMAMSAVSLDMISDHRFILGLGVGHKGVVEKLHGMSFEKPFSRIRETVEIVRRLMGGGQVSYEGKTFNLQNGSLGFPQEFHVPIYIAALGPQMMELAGELADGVLLNWAAPSYLKEALYHLGRGAARAGRDPKEIDVACYIRVAVTPDEEGVRASLRRQILRYASLEYYKNFFIKAGFGEEIQAIDHYLCEGDRTKAAASIGPQMERALAVFGSADFCRKEIDERRRLGVKMPVIAPFAVGGAVNSYRAAIEAFSG